LKVRSASGQQIVC